MCGGPEWKREIVPDHKFDFIDVREFKDDSCGMQMKYLWLYILVLKSFLVYVSDIFTALTMLTTSSWSNQIFNNCPDVDGCVFIPFNVGKWLFVGCIIFSFLLLAYEAHKAKKIVVSRDISYAFTNIQANNYYSLRSYPHFCFFDHISQSTTRSDGFAFFIFFTFKSWKRLLLADAPRQTINALTLWAIYLSKRNDPRAWWDVEKYFEGNTLVTSALMVSTAFTVLICAGSMLLLFVAGVLYIPLLCHIKGNLKEYCCHKVDKRIAAIIKKRNKKRMARAASLARKEAAGDFSHLKNKKGELTGQPLPQPTLPNIGLDEEDFKDTMSIRSREPPPGAYAGEYFNDSKSVIADYPTMPAYNLPYSHHQDPNNAYAHYNPSAPSIHDDYPDEYGSTAQLGNNAAYGYSASQTGYGHQVDATYHSSQYNHQADPAYQSSQYNYQSDPAYQSSQHGHQADPSYQHHGYVADPHDVYAGHGGEYADHAVHQQYAQPAPNDPPSYRTASPYRSASPAVYQQQQQHDQGHHAGGGQSYAV